MGEPEDITQMEHSSWYIKREVSMFYKFISLKVVTCIVLVVLIFVAAPTQAEPGDKNFSVSAVKIKPRDIDKLSTELNKTGRIRVIVGIASNDEPDATLQRKQIPTLAKRLSRRNAINRLQERVLGRLSNPRAVKRLRNLSYLALEVESEELQQLQEMNEVVSISEDELWSPTLDFSANQIGADFAWTAGYTGIGQAVAILDTGVDTNHPNFAGKIVAEACFSTGSGVATSLCPAGQNPNGADFQIGPGAGENCSGISSCDHGTHVAGIAAGSSSTYRGIAPDAHLIPIQVFSKFDSTYCNGASSCVLAYLSDVLRALDWIYDQRNSYTIASANLSLGGGMYQSVAECDQGYSALDVAIDNLRTEGIATVAASGNNGYTSAMSRPACISGVISVGGVGSSDGVASWSNSASWLSVLAPGVSIKSSVPGTGFGNKSGTSMATPHVAGAIAAMRSAKQDSTIDEIVASIVNTGIPVLDSRNGITKPRIQLDAAIGDLIEEPIIENTADIVLPLNTIDNTEYGWRWGDGLHKAEFTVAFQYTGIDLELDVTAFDIDYNDEISVHLNGDQIGYLSKGPNNGLNAGDTISIPVSQQIAGENYLEFRQGNPGWIWGVTNLLLKELVDEIVLIPHVLDTNEYGWRWGDNLHEAEVAAKFQSTGFDLELNVTAFDVDYNDEISVHLNGDQIGYLSKGPNNGLNAGDTISIPVSQQIAGENYLEFKQGTPGWVWGVTDLLLRESVDIVLTPNIIDTNEYGWRWGDGLHEAELSVGFQYTGADFELSVTAFDVDYNDEISVHLNGNLIGYLSKGPNDGLNAGNTFSIPVSQQQEGENRLEFRQRSPGWIWGVTNLLLSQ